VAALPLLTGMGPEAYRSAEEFGDTFRRAMPLCAGILMLGALIAWATIRTPLTPPTPAPAEEHASPECRMHCGASAPPLEAVCESPSTNELTAHESTAHELTADESSMTGGRDSTGQARPDSASR
jgi:hypothetical protein